jgi:hypothetical protein
MDPISAEQLKSTATEFMDHIRLAQTAEVIGAHATVKAERQAAAAVRQGLFGPDSQFKRN